MGFKQLIVLQKKCSDILHTFHIEAQFCIVITVSSLINYTEQLKY